MLNSLLDQKQDELKPHFKAGFLQRPNAIFQFRFLTDDDFYLTVEGDAFNFMVGTDDAATITLTIKDHVTCWGLLDGSIDGMKAFMEGTYRSDGNIVLSQLLLYLFKSNDPTIVYEVQY